ncbi:hypothetical protein KO494_07425 [Lacinutrix sp. C3R15]|uniref:hypothetical protein n=1 Tax=Flavobacteriaceae TaxID=49546 RepID=UPI001C093F4A|nr:MULTISPECIES: hypothetical protein [Flavobacteriaceae]MBU2939367.1 hypothetical protein [Lacinutrix sp. C3R15]MDO6622682.1 hypothetical protein [Oceanihabitans sp. 1_MG-2023]
MKNLKNIFLAFAALFSIVACETDADTVAEIADEAGLIVDVTATANSSILGSPEAGVDLEDAIVTITNAYLDMTVSQTAGTTASLEKIEIVKSFNGGTEISLAESTTLPYNLVISDLESLLAGTGVTESDLRIGDVLSFRTKVYKTDGSVYYFNSSMGDYSLVVNCSSDLAGTYAINYTSGLQNHIVTELGPGLYEIDSMMGWPGAGYAVTFTDTCGELSLIDEWQYSNPIYAEGYVDNDGNIVWTTSGVDGVYDGSAWVMYKQ